MLRITAAVLLCLIGSAPSARATDFPHITCPVVRALVAEHGRAKALALALEQGATWAQIREAYKCLKR